MNLSVNGITIQFNKAKIENTIKTTINSSSKGYICTINANLLTEANKNENFRFVLNNSLLNTCDGSFLAKSLSWVFNDRLEAWPGPDFFLEILKNKNYKYYFLGSNQKTLSVLKKNLLPNYPWIDDSKFTSLPYLGVDQFDYDKISHDINDFQADIVWLSLGAPKQEVFASKLLPYLNNGIIICVGAAFDFYGRKKGTRAPFFVRKLGLEWIWRIFTSPKKTIIRLQREVVTIPKILFKEKKRIKRQK
jgi:N-acetylglucosaminyldiphosphoundecaprenol N-acetyl-beta-D-mannosaminyltransferase